MSRDRICSIRGGRRATHAVVLGDRLGVTTVRRPHGGRPLQPAALMRLLVPVARRDCALSSGLATSTNSTTSTTIRRRRLFVNLQRLVSLPLSLSLSLPLWRATLFPCRLCLSPLELSLAFYGRARHLFRLCLRLFYPNCLAYFGPVGRARAHTHSSELVEIGSPVVRRVSARA